MSRPISRRTSAVPGTSVPDAFPTVDALSLIHVGKIDKGTLRRTFGLEGQPS
ncbi:MAG: hypothetical protein HSCHL_0329 [Hydrogenibacillus schlegelii]|uniref:Uncharacterized protein n=1 Tax=Hydrogenibacillus schlegelii TaxID=1484 RepID=A0A2T5GE07_HYDSH|nr:MAG: hypothetical protein HSCHL_0329 [Hydrogenibacillus schlegelii]